MCMCVRIKIPECLDRGVHLKLFASVRSEREFLYEKDIEA